MGRTLPRLNWRQIGLLSAAGVTLYLVLGIWWVLDSPPPPPPQGDFRPTPMSGLMYVPLEVRRLSQALERFAQEQRAEYQARGEEPPPPLIDGDLPPDSPRRVLSEIVRGQGGDVIFMFRSLGFLNRLPDAVLADRMFDLYMQPDLSLDLSVKSDVAWARHVPDLKTRTLRMLEEETSHRRANAVRFFGRVEARSEEDRQSLISLLESDPQGQVRSNAGRSLLDWEGQAAFARLKLALEREQDAGARGDLVYVIGLSRHPAAARVVETYLFDQEEPVRQEAAMALSRLGQPETAAALGEALLPDTQWMEPNLHAAQTLATIGTEEALGYLLRGVAHESATVRASCVQALGDGRLAAGLPTLIDRLQDPSRRVRLNAVLALEAIADPRAVQALAEQLKREKDSQIRMHIIQCIARLGQPHETEEALLRALRDRDQLVRFQTMLALEELGLNERPQIRRRLERIMQKDDYPALRLAAARVLGLRKGPIHRHIAPTPATEARASSGH